VEALLPFLPQADRARATMASITITFFFMSLFSVCSDDPAHRVPQAFDEFNAGATNFLPTSTPQLPADGALH
jgi:hypothetical protein